MPWTLRFLRPYRFLLVGLLAVAVWGFVAQRPRRLTGEELRIAGEWRVASSGSPGSPPVTKQLVLYVGRRYEVEAPRGPDGLSARETGRWAFAHGRLWLYSDDHPLNHFQGFHEFHWSLISERFRRIVHGPRPTHLIDLTIESENELRSPSAVLTRLNRLAGAPMATSSTVPAAGEGNAGD